MLSLKTKKAIGNKNKGKDLKIYFKPKDVLFEYNKLTTNIRKTDVLITKRFLNFIAELNTQLLFFIRVYIAVIKNNTTNVGFTLSG
ncbi:hypothetical protein [Polaribacter ponticola]|uniref:Uncharacterized protein n=1 Tax=Polaribacter ponticola TaxID=2978475 RepID=A0ABT5SCW2_9FLAO|nr:hypothetical protein [Polaribacter sp. MSW5]MDD7915122.1 hypothetical protein [Polaribacter sp. MSW5]